MTAPQPNRASLRLLVTGFGAFPGAPRNPTLALIAALARSRRPARFGVAIETRALPVVYAGAEARLAALIGETAPDAILHLGLAGRRRTLCVETRALNRVSSLHADAAGRFAEGRAVVSRGPAILRSRWRAARLVVAMRRAGAPTRLSIDAGDYVCNQTFYLTLAQTRGPAAFVHVPPPRRGGRPGRTARPSLAAMARAVEAAALALAREARG